jgi:hypothetical protein
MIDMIQELLGQTLSESHRRGGTACMPLAELPRAAVNVQIFGVRAYALERVVWSHVACSTIRQTQRASSATCIRKSTKPLRLCANFKAVAFFKFSSDCPMRYNSARPSNSSNISICRSLGNFFDTSAMQ